MLGIIAGCSTVSIAWKGHDDFFMNLIATPIEFILAGLLFGGIPYVIAGIFFAHDGSREKYNAFSSQIDYEYGQARDEQIRRIEIDRDMEIQQVQNTYTSIVEEMFNRLNGSPYANKVVDLMYNAFMNSLRSANHASYIKSINVVLWYHVYMDRIETYAEEFVEQGESGAMKAHPLGQRQFILKHEMLRNLETPEQCDALAMVIIGMLRRRILEKDKIASVIGKRNGSRCRISYKAPNSEVSSFIGF